MAPVLRVSEESYNRLKRWAEPLDDTADDAFRKVLDVADRHRQVCEQHDEADQAVALANIGEHEPPNDTGTDDPPDSSPAIPRDVAEDNEPMYVSLPEEFRYLTKGQSKMRGMLARRAYLERSNVSILRPRQWVTTADGMSHYLGYSSQNSPDLWFFGADEDLVEKHLRDSTLGSFVFLCGMSDSMLVAVPLGIEQVENMLGLGLFSKSGNQLKFNVKRDAGDTFLVEGRAIE